MEARATSALNHPNILTVYEIGESETGPYLVTEYVDGETVRSLLNSGPLPLAQALDIATQAAAGVASAHGAGVVHRDLTPENLMVSRNGSVKILDFGLAKLLRPAEFSGGAALGGHTATGMVIGTAGYLSPEQLRGGKASERSDVFSLGLVLYEMATGGNPFQRSNAADTFSAILRDDPAPLEESLPQAPEELTQIIRRALAKKPEERYASARELAADLQRIRALVGIEPVAEVASEVTGAPAHRQIGLFAVAGILAVAAGALLILRSC
jgi:serine/threonine protein kinase